MIFLQLFWTFFKIGSFTIGGGYAMVPIIEEELVRKKKWIDSSEFVDILALSQSAPGILAVNISIVTGYRIRKFTGAVTATLGTVLPSFIIILLIAMFFKQFQDNEVVERIFKGIRPAVVALIAAPVFKLGKSARITRYNLWIPIDSRCGRVSLREHQEKERCTMMWWQLFYSFFKIGLFGFGGGYAMLSMIQGEVVTRHAWLTPQEFTDIIAISQMTPGPIGINSATYIGYTATGSIWGAALATFALVLPSFIVMLILYKFFMRYHDSRPVTDTFAGLRPAVIGLIASAALVLMNTENFGSPGEDFRQFLFSLGIFAAVLTANFFFRVNAILLIILAGIAGFLIY